MNLLGVVAKNLRNTFRFWTGAISLGVFSPKEILIGVALIAVATATVDMFLWQGVLNFTLWSRTCILWFFYVLSLSLSTAFLISRFIPTSDFRMVLTMAACAYWAIPLVPFFSLGPWEETWDLGISVTIPFFRWIPTFLVEHNYLPLGMIVVAPVILLMTSRFMARTTSTDWWRAFILTLAALVLIYIYYYQWSQRAIVTAFLYKGFWGREAVWASYVTYSFLSQLITFLISPVFARSYGTSQLWKPALWAGVPLLVLLLMPRFGFFSVFLASSLP